MGIEEIRESILYGNVEKLSTHIAKLEERIEVMEDCVNELGLKMQKLAALTNIASVGEEVKTIKEE